MGAGTETVSLNSICLLLSYFSQSMMKMSALVCSMIVRKTASVFVLIIVTRKMKKTS